MRESLPTAGCGSDHRVGREAVGRPSVGLGQGEARLADPGPDGVGGHVVLARQLHRGDVVLGALADDLVLLLQRHVLGLHGPTVEEGSFSSHLLAYQYRRI